MTLDEEDRNTKGKIKKVLRRLDKVSKLLEELEEFEMMGIADGMIVSLLEDYAYLLIREAKGECDDLDE